MSCLTNITNTLDLLWKRNKSKIFTGIGITGIVVTPVLSGIATYNAIQIIEEEKKKRGVEELDPKDIFKLTWKCFIPTGLSMGVTMGSFIKSNSDNLKEIAGYAAAYSLSEERFKEYRKEAKEAIGEEKEKDINASSVQQYATESRNRYESQHRDFPSPNDRYWTIDSITGQGFWSTEYILESAKNYFNSQMISGKDEYVSYNEFLAEASSGEAEYSTLADKVGWNPNKSLIDLDITAEKDRLGRLYLFLAHKIGNEPYYGYDH